MAAALKYYLFVKHVSAVSGLTDRTTRLMFHYLDPSRKQSLNNYRYLINISIDITIYL